VVETEDDRSSLLADFGEPVVATVGGVVQPSVVAIFDDAYFEDGPGGEKIAASKPKLLMRSSDCANWNKGTTVVLTDRGAAVWRVTSPEPDGTGFHNVKLMERQGG
jgi:hypothetical protein